MNATPNDYLSRHYKRSQITAVDGYNLPPALKIRPLHALRSVMRLVADKEDTKQVYEVMNAISGKSSHEKFRLFSCSEYGRRVIDTPIKIESILADRPALKAMPAGSVGRVYHDFMSDDGISEQTLLEAAKESGIDYEAPNNFPAFTRQIIHFKVTHDLWHVLTGYGRDGLGELCLLEFYRGQWQDRGLRLITFIGLTNIRRQYKHLPIRAAAKEARKNSKTARWIMGEDIESYLAKPLEDVRRALNIQPPTIYQSIDLDVRNALLKPRALKTA